MEAVNSNPGFNSSWFKFVEEQNFSALADFYFLSALLKNIDPQKLLTSLFEVTYQAGVVDGGAKAVEVIRASVSEREAK
jgi:hypothetical protein